MSLGDIIDWVEENPRDAGIRIFALERENIILERENAELREDKEILDWLEETLVSLHTMSTPDMSGARISGQLRNKLRDDSGAAGPSYIRIFHPTIRAAVNAARAKEAKP